MGRAPHLPPGERVCYPGRYPTVTPSRCHDGLSVRLSYMQCSNTWSLQPGRRDTGVARHDIAGSTHQTVLYSCLALEQEFVYAGLFTVFLSYHIRSLVLFPLISARLASDRTLLSLIVHAHCHSSMHAILISATHTTTLR